MNKEDYRFFMLLFFMATMLGGMLNLTAWSTNDGKMPVKGCYDEWWGLEDREEHFCYIEKDEVNNWVVTDWIKIPGRWISIGDIFIVGGLIGSLINLIIFWRRE